MPPSDQPEMIALLGTLIRDELCLGTVPPRVFLNNTSWDIPADKGLFVALGLIGQESIGGGSGYGLDPEGVLVERQIEEAHSLVTVDAFSMDTSARARLSDIYFALTGDAAQRLSEEYSLRIFRPGQWHDLSSLEASRRLNRFQTQFSVFQGFGLQKPVPYMQPNGKRYFGEAFAIQP